MKWIKTLTPWLGIALCIAIMARKIWVYGEEWEFSPRGIPVSALSADRSTYRNGSSIDPISRFIIESGYEEVGEAVLLGMLLFSIVLLGFHVAAYKRAFDANARGEARGAVFAFAKELEQAGRREEAQEAYDFYWSLFDAEMAQMKRDRSMKRHFDEAMRKIDEADSKTVG